MTTVGCSDSSGPDHNGVPPGLRFVKGNNITDTVSSIQSERLQVSVGDESGRPVPRATVVFTSMLLTEAGGVGPVLIGKSTDTTFKTFYYDSTDTDGMVSVRVKLGDVAGRGAVIVNVPSLQLTDTAEYTILPGKAARFTLLPEDTAIAVGKSMSLRGRVTDRFGNVRNDPLSYRVTGNGVTVTAAGTATATQPARVAIIATLPGLPGVEDTTLVSAIPDFTVAVRNANSLATMQLDGSNYRTIPSSFLVVEPGPRWAPDGQSLLVAAKTTTNETVFLEQVNLNGTFSMLPPNVNGIGGVGGFDFSPDGRSIYLSAGNCNYSSVLYRLTVGSTGPERLSPPSGPFPDECFNTVYNSPSASPDGKQIVYENSATAFSGFNIRLFEIATRTVRVLNVTGRQPRWAPAGDLIAYWADNRIWVMNNNGTGSRAVTAANRMYTPGASWSRDGQWIVARYQPSQGNASLTTTLINVASGLELPVAYFAFPGSFSLPDFRPN